MTVSSADRHRRDKADARTRTMVVNTVAKRTSDAHELAELQRVVREHEAKAPTSASTKR